MTTASEQPVVLVTGATSWIGKATAELLAAEGCRVLGTSRDPAGKTANGFELLQLEVSSDESVAACVSAVAERTGGRIDVLLNNAGTGIIGAAEEVTPEEALRLFQVNFFGVMRVTNAVLLSRYSAILVMDDDVLISGSSISRLFEIRERHDLWALQAAFSPRGKISWPITEARRRNALRFTNFIEMTCPLFRRDKLDDFEDLMRTYDIVELQRTGRVALPKLERQAPRLRSVKGA